MMRKILFREIRGSLGRYLAILAIIALGTGFFAGLRVCRQTMLNAGNGYIISQRLFDYRLISTLGYEDVDVASIADVVGVEAAEGSFSLDVLAVPEYSIGVNNSGDSSIVLKVMSLPGSINVPKLTAGRMPQAPNECLADALSFTEESLNTTISISPSNKSDTLENLCYDTYTIVGLATSPLYLNFERGATSVGTGVISAYIYIPEDGFDVDYYTEIYLTLEGSDQTYIYSDIYTSLAEGMEDSISKAAEDAARNRYERILSEAQSALDEAQGEYDQALRDYESARGEAEQELEDARQELLDAEKQLSQGWTDLREGRATFEREIASAREKLADYEKELEDGRAALEEGEEEYSAGLAEYQEALEQYLEGRAAYEDGLEQYNKGLSEYESSLAAYQENKEMLDQVEIELMVSRNQLENYETQYNDLLLLYNGVSALAEANGMDASAFMASLNYLIQAAAAGDPVSAGMLAALDMQLASHGLGSTAELTTLWSQAESQIQAAGYGTTLDDASLAAMRETLNRGWAEYVAGYAEFRQAKEQLENAAPQLEDARRQLDETWQKLEDAWVQLESGAEELAKGQAELEDARSQLDAGWADYYAGLDELQNATRTLNQEAADTEDELRKAEAELIKGQKDYQEGLAAYEEAKAEADAEFKDAEEKLEDGRKSLEDARQELQDLSSPKTYTLSRQSNVGYVCLESDSQIVHGVSAVFPLFFLIVAALVCITTMTRMVEEQRTQIGVLKALGYSGGFIASKYLLYSGSASLIGCVGGFLAGSYFVPKVIWEAYKIMYNFGEISFCFDPLLAAICILAYLLCAMAATWISCRSALKEVPAELIRPKAPKAGKRVLLERIPFIWRRTRFLSKVSIRNILRYRQRLIMMLVGISGCTSLLLTGYGIRDSITNLISFQYEEITLYDCSVTLTEGRDSQWVEQTLKPILGSSAEDMLLTYEGSMDLVVGGKEKSVTVVIPDGDVSPFVSLHKDDQPIAYPGAGEAVISMSLADMFGLSPGDRIKLRDPDLNELTLTVSGVFENYVKNYIYLSAESCLDQWGFVPDMKAVLINFSPDADPNSASAKLLGQEDVAAVSVSAEIIERISGMMSSMDYIVLLVIVCAAALAFIVLYNLTNISITERLREIATIKVLGFYPIQSAVYVFRENMVLTGLGAILGLGLGVVMHRYVMSQIKIEMVYFDPRIAPLSFILSAVLTLIFALLVDFFMYSRIQRINMAEALKSVE